MPDLEIIGIPQVGLPVVTTAGVELTAEGVPSVTAVLNTPPPGPADPLAPPVLQQAELTFSNNEPVVVLSGSNFLNDFNDVGSSFEDLAVEFRVGNKSYPGILIPDRSVELGDNRYEIAIEVPNIVVLGEAEIVLIRRQKEQIGPLPTDSEIVEKESNPIQLTPTCVELALVARETADTISIINAHTPESVIEAGSSSDLLRANIPVGTPDREDKPVELAATNNATRAYVLLQESGRVGLVDLMTWRQVDTHSETPEIDPINLPAGASPQSIALDPGDNYAYIADGKIGALYILDINPNSATYHQIIQTISLPSASWGLRQLSMSSDGRKLFVAAPDYSWPFSDTKGQIHVVNIDPRDRPTNPENNSRLWHEKIGSISTYSEVDGVFAKNNGGIAFTNSRRDSAGFGVVEILNDDPLNFTVGTPRYVSLGLGSFSDYFDINWAVSVDILRDGSYAFVASKNNSSQTGVESIDGLRAGSNIGIIKDPFGPDAKLVAAT
ncbi:DNA/RNA endonuclease G, partial [Phormidium pseudopriestleyi FRX01]|nr:DNA/RNA endonuclease G [Phormidium pseudopriestleyi FRX01]